MSVAMSSEKKTEQKITSNGVNATHTPESPSYNVPPYAIGVTEPGGPLSQAQAKLDAKDYLGGHNKFPRISRPVELLRHKYDVVVIGSGYGGGVAASRMARAGQSVCLLERGKERWPGEYPSSLAEAGPEVSVSGQFAPNGQRGKQVQIGDPSKLYHLIVGEGQNAFVASGLGGTSLLNANVFLEADAGTMSLPAWPDELRNTKSLEKCEDVFRRAFHATTVIKLCLSDMVTVYKRAASVLEPEPYPEDFPPLAKLDLLEKQAKLLGLDQNFRRVPQTTRFENGPNSTGIQMQASANTGMDSTGVNDGSKSSTLVNYLSDAWNWGAEIFCECEVRYVKKHPSGDGYLVFFAWHGSKRAKFHNSIYSDLMWVHASKFVFFGAGTLGTTELLLRSKVRGLSMSENVGTNMSGNGDILAFGYNTDETANGMGTSFPDPNRPVGPTITGVIDCRDQPNPLDGFVIEEGTVPEALVTVLQLMLETMPGQIPPKDYGIMKWIRDVIARNQSRIYRYAPGGSLEKTQTYLIMSHDSNQAIMTLKDDKPVLTFLGVGRSDHVQYLNGLLAKATNAVGGTFINSPFFAELGKQEITVHPIGGAIIARDGTGATGVVNQYGELFTGQGPEVHSGLVMVDGSVVPTALGVNPFATITALAERSVAAAAGRAGLKIDFTTKNGVLNLFESPWRHQKMYKDSSKAETIIKAAESAATTGVEFAEVMTGFISTTDDTADFVEAAKAGSDADQAARFFLSCRAWDTNALIERDDHPAMLTGTFTSGALPGSPYMVLRGDFNLFNKDPRTPDTTNLTYDFDMISTKGEEVHFHGYKIVDRSVAFSIYKTWKATSTLYVTLTRKDGSVIARGMLHIQPKDFISELETFTAIGPSLFSRLKSTSQFLAYFTQNVASNFLGPLSSLQWPTTTYAGYYIGKTTPSETKKLVATDGVISTFQRWKPTLKEHAGEPPRVLLIPGASVDHQIFALPTIKKNAVEYFQDAGFEVFCVTHRTGKTPVAQRGYTTFDARLDIRAAFKEVHAIQGSAKPIYVVAHCAGSVALSAGLLDGTINSAWIAGMTASQVFFNPIFGKVNTIKASLPVPMTKIYQKLAGSWFSCISSQQDTLIQRLLNQVVRFYPVESMVELCNSVVCHRSELVFGRLWSHKRLNEATHANLSKFLGGVSMKGLEHLMYMGTHGYVTNNENESLLTAHNIQRLAGLPIFFMSGTDNVVYTPESTDKSYTKLTTTFGTANYSRKEYKGYGHLDCWMGADAAKDIYPDVIKHAKRTMYQ